VLRNKTAPIIFKAQIIRLFTSGRSPHSMRNGDQMNLRHFLNLDRAVQVTLGLARMQYLPCARASRALPTSTFLVDRHPNHRSPHQVILRLLSVICRSAQAALRSSHIAHFPSDPEVHTQPPHPAIIINPRSRQPAQLGLTRVAVRALSSI